MNLGKVDTPIIETNASDALPFAPTPASIKLSKPRDLPNGGADREGLRMGDYTDDLEVHRFMLANRREGVKPAAIPTA